MSEKDLYEKLTRSHLEWKRDELSRQLANASSISEYIELSNKIKELNDEIGIIEKESDL